MSTPSPSFRAAVRCLSRPGTGAHIKSFADLVSAQSHARRQDLTSKARQRPDRDHAQNYFWSLAGEGPEEGTNYVAAFKRHKERHGIKSDGNGALAMHMLVIVSPAWLEETGDPRDLRNPRVMQLIQQARDWAEEATGKDSVWAVRYDTDETGAGNVDILCSPVRADGRSKNRPKMKISIGKALQEIARKHGRQKTYAALQDSWADHAARHLDPRIMRGEENSGREHLAPEAYKALLAEKQALAKERADLDAEKETVAAKDAHLREFLESEPEDPVVLTMPSPLDLLRPKGWIAEQNERISDDARERTVRLMVAERKVLQMEKERDDAVRLSQQAQALQADLSHTRWLNQKEKDKVRKLEKERARIQKELERACSDAARARADLNDWRNAAPPDLLEEVAPALGMQKLEEEDLYETRDGRKFRIDEEGWEDCSGKARGISALVLAIRVLRIRTEKIISLLVERFGLARMQADMARVFEQNASRNAPPPPASGPQP